MARGFSSALSISSRSPLAGINHYAQKLISEPKVTTEHVRSPNMPTIKAPSVSAPKLSALGGLGQPSMPTGGGLALPKPPRVKQTIARIQPMRRQIVKAAPIKPPTGDEGDLI